jgi:uncharacterized repeat protein (TIGR03847 family)
MPGTDIELDPVDFVTVGTVGPKGRRLFHLQAGSGEQLITLIIEKQQAMALAEGINEMLETLTERYPDLPEVNVNMSRWDMSLRDPLEPLFRVAQMGLGYDEERHMILLVVQELVPSADDEPESVLPEEEPQVVRLWATREQMCALSEHARGLTEQGRADPKSNGHIIFYWT